MTDEAERKGERLDPETERRLTDLFSRAHAYAENYDFGAACFTASEAIQEYEQAPANPSDSSGGGS